MTFIYFVLVFGIIITIHELGHLIAAKAFNVYCEEFSFGMGPLLFGKKFKETTYNVRLFPIGGYVAMAGEPDASFDQVDIPKERTIKGISKWKQIIIMLAGVFMNFVLALVFFIGINLLIGQVQQPAKPIISEVVVNSPAFEAGMLKGPQGESKGGQGVFKGLKGVKEVEEVQSLNREYKDNALNNFNTINQATPLTTKALSSNGMG